MGCQREITGLQRFQPMRAAGMRFVVHSSQRAGCKCAWFIRVRPPSTWDTMRGNSLLPNSRRRTSPLHSPLLSAPDSRASGERAPPRDGGTRSSEKEFPQRPLPSPADRRGANPSTRGARAPCLPGFPALWTPVAIRFQLRPALFARSHNRSQLRPEPIAGGASKQPQNRPRPPCLRSRRRLKTSALDSQP